MKPTVYIESDFFESFNQIRKIVNIAEINPQHYCKDQLLKILNESTIINNKKIVDKSEYFKNDDFNDIERIILKRANKNLKLKLEPFDKYSQPGAIYMLGKKQKECKIISEENGVKSIGKNYDFETSIFPNSFASKPCSKDMEGEGIDSFTHYCQNMIIIDPYFFTKTDTRIPNFCKLLNRILSKKNNNHVSIISESKNGKPNESYEKSINEIKNKLSNKKINISIYLHKNKKFESNRHIITDYCIADLQHLLDRDATISADFLYLNDIDSNYRITRNFLKKITKSYKEDPQSFGIYKTKINDILENPILSNFET